MSKIHPSRNIERCPRCGRRFRDPSIPIVTCAFINGKYREECPLCYAKDFRKMTGIRWEPSGEVASFMLQEARRTMIRR
jgi:hypothetical protein